MPSSVCAGIKSEEAFVGAPLESGGDCTGLVGVDVCRVGCETAGGVVAAGLGGAALCRDGVACCVWDTGVVGDEKTGVVNAAEGLGIGATGTCMLGRFNVPGVISAAVCDVGGATGAGEGTGRGATVWGCGVGGADKVAVGVAGLGLVFRRPLREKPLPPGDGEEAGRLCPR